MEYEVRPQQHTPGPWFRDQYGYVYGQSEPQPIDGFSGSKSIDQPLICNPVNARDGALIAAAPDLLAKCQKIVAWLDRLADRAESEAKDTRFESLAEAYAADAKNYRATASDVRTVIAKATGSAS